MHLRTEILTIIEKLPEVTGRQICELIPEKNPATIRAELSKLYRQGKITRVKAPKSPDDTRSGGRTGFAYSIGQPPKAAPARPKLRVVEPTVAGLQARIAQLQQENGELKRWQEEAIKRFPDLAVDPIVLEARHTLAAEMEGNARDDILAGRKDNCPAMRAVIAALSRKVA